MNYLLANLSLEVAPQKIQSLRASGYDFATAFMAEFPNQSGASTGDWICARFTGPLPADALFDPPGVEYRRGDESWSCSHGAPALPDFLLDSLLDYFKQLEGQYWS